MKPFLGIVHEAVRLDGKIKNVDYELVHQPAENYYTLASIKQKNITCVVDDVIKKNKKKK